MRGKIDPGDQLARSALFYLWQSEDCADFTIRTTTRDFRAHKCIYSAQTDYFNNRLQGSQSMVVEVEVDAETMDAIHRFVYGVHVPAMPFACATYNLEACKFAMDIREAGKKFGIPVIEQTWRTISQCLKGNASVSEITAMACEASRDPEDAIFRLAVERAGHNMLNILEDREATSLILASPLLFKLATIYAIKFGPMWTNWRIPKNDIHKELHRVMREYLTQRGYTLDASWD